MNFKEIKERLNTQDNRATADPIFIVYDWEKVPSCSDYTDTWEYVDTDEGHEIGNTVGELIEFLKDNDMDYPEEEEESEDGDSLVNWLNNRGVNITKFYYIKKRVFINVFFTEKAADIFIAQNHYHYTKEVHTYVACLWRNPEMQFIREMIMSGKLDACFPERKNEVSKNV